ncbi:MAG: SpoIIE family protein phosphatase [Methylotetracoccus sp.]
MAEERLQGLQGIAAHRIVVLLIDDQRIIGEAVRRMLLDEPDIEFHFCSDPQAALEHAARVEPTLILQDLVMPGVDGLDLVKLFRADPKTRRTPLIVLSSKEDPKIKAEAFALGANDYLIKLPDRVELLARMRYHSNAYIALLERDEAYQALTAELAEAADYVRSLLPRKLSGPINSDWEFVPSTSLGGDAFGHFDADDEHFVFFLLDVCGHGVGAALLSLSAMNSMVQRTLPRTDFRNPGAVLEALNAALPMEQHNNLYFTIWYGAWHRPSRTLRYAVAGHPPALLFSGDTRPLELRQDSLPIGVLDEQQFDTGETVIPPGGGLYLFSDGLYEIRRVDGSEFTFGDFVARLGSAHADTQASPGQLLADMRGLQGRAEFDDDVSVLRLEFA